MDNVYVLWHSREIDSDFEDDVKLIGIYSSHEMAEAAVLRVRDAPGFSTSQEGFEIAEYRLNRDQWTSGFITEQEYLESINTPDSN